MKTKINRIKALLVISVLALLAALGSLLGLQYDAHAAKSRFESGSGTAADPFVIKTVEQFNAIITRADAYFVQAENLDFTGKEFHPVGDLSLPFTGHYDGKQYMLKGINADFSGSENVGVFAFVYGGAVVKNLRVEDSVFKGRANVGAIAGSNAGRIEGCYANATVIADNSAGGITGNNAGVIEKSVNAGKVEVNGMYGGGIAGVNSGRISNSYNKGNVNADTYVGGITALNNGKDVSAVIERTFNVGGVSGNVKANIAGDNLNGEIKQARFIEGTGLKSVSGFNTGEILSSLARPAFEFKSKTAFSDWAEFDDNFMFIENGAHPILKAEYVKVKGIQFNVAEKIKLKPNEEAAVSAKVIPAHASVQTVRLSVASGNEFCTLKNGVLRINEDAVVGGKITVVGEADGKAGTFTVEVVKIPVEELRLIAEDGKSTVVPGGSLKLTTEIAPYNASIKDVMYATTSPFADVDYNGKVTVSNDAPIGVEFLVTVASYDNVNIRSEYKLKVVEAAVKSVNITNKIKDFKVTESLNLTAFAETENQSTTENINFTIIEAGTTALGARIVNGVLEAEGLGVIEVVPEFAGVKGSSVIFNVLPEPVTDLEFLNRNKFAVDDALALIVQVVPENATHREVLFSISGENSVGAEINGNVLKAQTVGVVTVRAEADGRYAEQTVYIEGAGTNDVTVEAISLAQNQFYVTRSLLLQAVLSPADASAYVYFEIIDDGGTSATIKNGVLTAKSTGTVYVKAYTSQFETVLTVDVLKVPVQSVVFDNHNRFNITGGVELKAVAMPANATYPTVTYELLKDKTTAEGAEIRNGNYLVAKSTGIIVVRALADGVYSQEFTVYADKEPVTEVKLTSTSRNFKHTQILELNAIALPVQATFKDIVFSINYDPFKTTVTGAEIVDGNKLVINGENPFKDDCWEGIVTVVMHCDGRDYEVVLYVEREPIIEISELVETVISENKSETQFRTSGALELAANIYPFNTTNQNLRFEIVSDGGTGAKLIDEIGSKEDIKYAEVLAFGKSGQHIFLTAAKPGKIIIRVTSLDNEALYKDFTVTVLEEYVSEIYFTLQKGAEKTAESVSEKITGKQIAELDGAAYYYYENAFMKSGGVDSLVFGAFPYASSRKVDPTDESYKLYYYKSEEDYLTDSGRIEIGSENDAYFDLNDFTLSPKTKMGVLWVVAISEHGADGEIISPAIKITVYPTNIKDLKSLKIDNYGIIKCDSPEIDAMSGYEVTVKSKQFEFTKIIETKYTQLQLKLYKNLINSYDVEVNALFDYGTKFEYRFKIPTENFHGIRSIPKNQFAEIKCIEPENKTSNTTQTENISLNKYNAIVVYDLYRASDYNISGDMVFDEGVKLMYVFGNPDVSLTDLNFTFGNNKDTSTNPDIEIYLNDVNFTAKNNADAIRINGDGTLTLNVIGQVELHGGKGDDGKDGISGYSYSSTSSAWRGNNGKNGNLNWNPFASKPHGEEGKHGSDGYSGGNATDGTDGQSGGFAIRLQGAQSVFKSDSDKIDLNMDKAVSLILVGGDGGDGGNGGNGGNGQRGGNGGNGGNGGEKYAVMAIIVGDGGRGGNGGKGGDGGRAGYGGDAGCGGLSINSEAVRKVIGKNGKDGKNGTIGIAGTNGKGAAGGSGGSGGSGGYGVIVCVPYHGSKGSNGSNGAKGSDGAIAYNGVLKQLTN
ncbi:MAG: hypothetical protein K2I30_02765 [Clostridia bacterium]|nr:hypothetical protein [Clostridia bacterium]